MLEQDLASIMRFLTIHSGNPAPYYKNVPEQFCVPAVYFPRPEIGSSGDTFSTYALDFLCSQSSSIRRKRKPTSLAMQQ